MWHYGEPTDGVLQVTIDRQGKPVNAFSAAALDELETLIERIRGDSSLQAVIFRSGKPGNFIAGADVEEMKDLSSEQEAREVSQRGQRVFAELEALRVPTIALISGACLGGGLEFALACDYRIADDSSKTVLGLPEVKLGLIPGWGGTVRLPRLIGLFDALPLILTGSMMNGVRAKRKGIVQDVVPPEALDRVGERLVETIRKKGSADSLFRPRKKPLWTRLAQQVGFVQKFVLDQAAKRVQKETHGHYPAPFEAIEALKAGIEGPEAGFAAEAGAIGRLLQSPVTVELIRLFFLQEDSKKPPEEIATLVDKDAVREAAVIGAGAMGAGIALLLAKKGVWTRLKDLKPEFVSKGMQTIDGLLAKDVKRKKLSKHEAERALDRLSPTTEYQGLRHADVVVEAVIEDLPIKRQVFADLAAASGERTVLATNTSSLLVSDIARDVPHPERVVGLHFFNPPHKMPLVEVVKTGRTSPEALATAFAAVQKLGKTAVVVGDCAGFLVNRLLSPYMNEAGFLLAEVDDPMEIERAAVDFGMPMGPLELTDLVGLDVAAHVAENMHAAYGDRMEPAPLWGTLKELRQRDPSAEAKLIEKSKQGKRLSPHVADTVARMRDTSTGSLSREEIVQRLIYPIVDEAARCLDEGVALKPEDVDLAMVFGTGFAPFRGGPLRYADTVGVSNIVQTLERLGEEHPRLAPSEALKRYAAGEHGFLGPITNEEHAAVA